MWLSNPLNRIWLFLLAATLVTFSLGESGLAGRAGVASLLVMFGLAYTKGILVILDFMELRHAPLMWRVLLIGWLSLVVAAIGLAWWLGLRAS